MQTKTFFDNATYTLTYVVYDPETRDAVVIDPVLDYDILGSQTATTSFRELSSFVSQQKLKLHYVLETHAHADHISASQLLRQRYGAKVAIGEKIATVQQTFKKVFDLPESFATDGSQFDQLLRDGDTLEAGSLNVEVIPTPGHTPACCTFKIDDALYVGDTMFMEDFGTGRCDFPAGSAAQLYDSITQRLFTLPDETRVFVGHDYQPGGRELRYETTIGSQKASNKQLRADTSREEFVKFRTERDASLKAPKLLFQSVQVNINAGRLPEVHANGIRYIHLPLNLFGPTDDIGNPIENAAAAE